MCLKGKCPFGALSSLEQQLRAGFAASSRHLRNSQVLTSWLEKQETEGLTPAFETEEVSNNLAHLQFPPLQFFKAHFGKLWVTINKHGLQREVAL